MSTPVARRITGRNIVIVGVLTGRGNSSLPRSSRGPIQPWWCRRASPTQTRAVYSGCPYPRIRRSSVRTT